MNGTFRAKTLEQTRREIERAYLLNFGHRQDGTWNQLHPLHVLVHESRHASKFPQGLERLMRRPENQGSQGTCGNIGGIVERVQDPARPDHRRRVHPSLQTRFEKLPVAGCDLLYSPVVKTAVALSFAGQD